MNGLSFDGGPVVKTLYKIKEPALRLVFLDDFGEDWDADGEMGLGEPRR